MKDFSVTRKIMMLCFSVLWIAFAFAGLKGFPFWYGGFVLSFWLALGFYNYSQKTSVWLVHRRSHLFFGIYIPLVICLTIFDLAAQKLSLWTYPFYSTYLDFVWVYFILYPFASFALIELFYFVASIFDEKLAFKKHKNEPVHELVDQTESVLLFLIILCPILILAGANLSMSALLAVNFAWIAISLVKTFFHFKNPWHYLGVIVLSVFIAVLLNEVPNTVAFEWVHLKTSILNFCVLGVPLWMYGGWLWFTLFVLRAWTSLATQPKYK